MAEGMPGAGLISTDRRQVPSDMPALKPYWGKPAVRNFRGGDGNVGIIRSPVRAIVLPDWLLLLFLPIFSHDRRVVAEDAGKVVFGGEEFVYGNR